jgi:hypothetical protein
MSCPTDPVPPPICQFYVNGDWITVGRSYPMPGMAGVFELTFRIELQEVVNRYLAEGRPARLVDPCSYRILHIRGPKRFIEEQLRLGNRA